MRNTDEDALVCDFAEVYHVTDYKSLPLLTAATFAQGLPERSRIMRRLSGAAAPTETQLLAVIADRLGLVAWMMSEDGHRGKNRPASILDVIMRKEDPGAAVGFASGEAFADAWAQITGGENHAN